MGRSTTRGAGLRRVPGNPGPGSTGDLFAVESRPIAPSALPQFRPSARSKLWLALEFPELPSVVLKDAVHSPTVVVEGLPQAEVVIGVNPAARALDIRIGMRLGIARLRSDALRVIARHPEREQVELARLARHAQRFTPLVSLESPHALLLEIKGSQTLFGGLPALCETVRSHYQRLGHPVHTATAVTARGALWLARTGQHPMTDTPDALRQHLTGTPIEVARWPAPVVALCQRIGVRSLGELRRLPREGLTARIGVDALGMLDEAYGERPDVRRRHVVAERFMATLELPSEVHSTQYLLPAIDHLLSQLELFLRSRDCGVMQLTLRCLHRGGSATSLKLGRAWPSAQALEWSELIRERLARVVLAAPIERLQLRSGPCLPSEVLSRDLPGTAPTVASATMDVARLLERLRARLGDDAVQGMRLVAEHRPERAYQHLSPDPTAAVADSSANCPVPPRPLWLIDPPELLKQPQGHPWLDGRLIITSGPERIESGWWDGQAIARDYYVAAGQQGRRFWIFRTRVDERTQWFLQGVFA